MVHRLNTMSTTALIGQASSGTVAADAALVVSVPMRAPLLDSHFPLGTYYTQGVSVHGIGNKAAQQGSCS
ncbi:hypothetical protein GCM10017668_58920 [Streptomyces tuirus]|uniref:Uncharacterized protein n=1 Tax=Streptomyces tuirus TaxID=68278 RepID=A0A7G1NMN9_9ACTN|nr:hypothetical protein GCM10017668_58920 [Streptomyces tuirus]